MGRSKTRIKLHPKGFEQLLKSPQTQAILEERAESIAVAADIEFADHHVHVEVSKNRARAAVTTATHEARIAEARDGNLTRAISAAL